MDATSVEALAYLGLLEAQSGRRSEGKAMLRESLDHATRMGRLSLETRARLFLAQHAIASQDAAGALAIADEIPADTASRSIGPELRALVRYWRGEALRVLGDEAGSRVERTAARSLIEQIRDRLPEQFRAGFTARRDITTILR